MRIQRGFTLIELLVVIAIIGIVASIILLSLSGDRGKARDANREGTIDTIRTALEMYNLEYGHYPFGIAYSPWMNGCGTLNWKNCDNNHGDPIGDLVSAGLLPGPLRGDPDGDCEDCGGGEPNYLGDGFSYDRGFVYCSGSPRGNCPDAPTTQTYVLGTNLESSSGNFVSGENPNWGTYQFHMP